MKKIYVGNLPFNASEDQIQDLFTAYGDVHSVRIILDRDSGKPRGFCFVEMDSANADAAISALNGATFGGRGLKVNEAKERESQRRAHIAS